MKHTIHKLLHTPSGLQLSLPMECLAGIVAATAISPTIWLPMRKSGAET
jgi:hypothetical protein